MATRWGVDSVEAIGNNGNAGWVNYYSQDLVTFWGRYFGPSPGRFGWNYVTNSVNATQVNAELDQLRQYGINWIVPLLAPGEVPGTVNQYGQPLYRYEIADYNFGRDDALAFCQHIVNAVNLSNGKLFFPTLRPYTGSNGVTSSIFRVYLNVEPTKWLTQQYWNGFAETCWNFSVNGQFPFFPCIYLNSDPNLHPANGQTCSVAGNNPVPFTCHGSWAQQPTYCSSSSFTIHPAWTPQTCAGIAGGPKLWQYDNVVCGNFNGVNVDVDQSTPVFGDDEIFYMLYVPPPPFGDTLLSENLEAIRSLTAFNVVKGTGNGNFNPTGTATRSEMTAFICRAIPSAMTSGACVGNTWACEDWSSDPNTYFHDLYLADPELQRTIRTLKHYGIANGYGDGYFGTLDPVLKAQVISFITRALVYRGYWYHLQNWDPGVYANVGWSSGHRQDILTYYRYVGPIYGTESNIWNWSDWTANAQRQWFAEVEWRAFKKAGI